VIPRANGGPVVLTADQATRQSLATGTAGIALLHIERALAGSGDWAGGSPRSVDTGRYAACGTL
jgi:hypothetical protein